MENPTKCRYINKTKLHLQRTRSLVSLKEKYDASPGGIDQQKDDPDSVGDAVASGERIPKTSGSSDVLLEEVTPDDQAYQYTEDTVANRIGEEAWCDYQEKDQ